MKKIFFASAVTAACFLISCDSKTESKTASTNAESMKSKNLEVYRAIETGDGSKIKDYLAKDAIDHNGGPNGEDVVGGDSIIAMLTSFHSAMEPGFKMNVISQAVDGEYLFALIEMSGTTKANPGMGMPPATKMNSRGVDVIRVVDGKAKEHWAFMSSEDVIKMRAEMMKQMKGGASNNSSVTVDTATHAH